MKNPVSGWLIRTELQRYRYFRKCISFFKYTKSNEEAWPCWYFLHIPRLKRWPPSVLPCVGVSIFVYWCWDQFQQICWCHFSFHVYTLPSILLELLFLCTVKSAKTNNNTCKMFKWLCLENIVCKWCLPKELNVTLAVCYLNCLKISSFCLVFLWPSL